MFKFFMSGCLLFSAVAAASAAGLNEIVCEGAYPFHLQGAATDGTNIFWSFTTVLVKTDRNGKVLAKDEISRDQGHMGDLCCRDGKVFVGMNMGKAKVSAEYPSIAPITKRFDSYTAEGMLVMDGVLWIAHGINKIPDAKAGESRWSARLLRGQYTEQIDGVK